MMDNNGKPIYFDSISNSAYVLGRAEHSARDSWVYIDGESFLPVPAQARTDPPLFARVCRRREKSLS
jgi:hypothetical protein